METNLPTPISICQGLCSFTGGLWVMGSGDSTHSICFVAVPGGPHVWFRSISIDLAHAMSFSCPLLEQPQPNVFVPRPTFFFFFFKPLILRQTRGGSHWHSMAQHLPAYSLAATGRKQVILSTDWKSQQVFLVSYRGSFNQVLIHTIISNLES